MAAPPTYFYSFPIAIRSFQRTQNSVRKLAKDYMIGKQFKAKVKS